MGQEIRLFPAIRIGVWGMLFLFISASPALANNPPGPNVFLAEILILPWMIGCSLLGGFYALTHDRKKKRFVPRLLGAIVAIFLSGMQEGLAMLVAMVFCCMALIRGFHMLYLGVLARKNNERLGASKNASLLRLLPAGILLVIGAVFFAGMSVAFQSSVGGRFFSEERTVERLKAFTAYQLAYARKMKETEGEVRFHRATKNHPYPMLLQYKVTPDRFFPIRVEFDDGNAGFTAYVPPRLPFFPYNYLTSAPSYRADESGDIRMIRVHRPLPYCPADAPVVMRVGENDLEEMKKIVLESMDQGVEY